MRNKKSKFQGIKDFFDIYGRLIGRGIIFLIFGVLIYLAIIPNPMKKASNEKKIYRNERLRIVGTNESAQDFTHDKFHKPIVIKVWLVQRLKDTTQFAELSSYHASGGFQITEEQWYSKGIGDTLFFDYILKERFFTINKK